MAEPKQKYIQIRDRNTGRIFRSIEVTEAPDILLNKVIRGIKKTLNHKDFEVTVGETNEKKVNTKAIKPCMAGKI